MEKTLPPSLTVVFDDDLKSYSPDFSSLLEQASSQYFQSFLNIKKAFQKLQLTILNGDATNRKEIGACFRELEILIDYYIIE
jgi:hypothetical protein